MEASRKCCTCFLKRFSSFSRLNNMKICNYQLQRFVFDVQKRLCSTSLQYVQRDSKCVSRQSQAPRLCGQPAPETHKHLMKAGEVTPGLSKTEFRERRERLTGLVLDSEASRNHQHHICIISSAPKCYMSAEVPYVYRQNTDFRYLTGFLEMNSVLLLEISQPSSVKSILFVECRNEHKLLWEGPCSGLDGTIPLTGVDEVHDIANLKMYLDSEKGRKNVLLWHDILHGESKIGLHEALVQACSSRRKVQSLLPLIQELRVVKSKAECKLMSESCKIGAQSLKQVIRSSHSGVNEHVLFAKMDFESRIRGAEFLAYPPVVAGGNRANTIHYISNNNVVPRGDLVLMDAGCEFHGYVSDITRTWPVSGTFSRYQRELYEALLQVQESLIRKCAPGININDLYLNLLAELGVVLQEVKLIKTSLSAMEIAHKAQQYCPHHVGHYLGMDVHDTPHIAKTRPLQPGMHITIEPGIYIPSTDTEAPKELRGIGMRIEDDIEIVDGGHSVLSSSCPKTVCEIEKLFGVAER